MEPKVFDIFTSALASFEKEDAMLLSWHNKLAIAHALANKLEKFFQEQNKNLSVDLCPVISKSSKIVNPEIVVHNRKTGKTKLIVYVRTDYLKAEEQQSLKELATLSKADAIFAVSFMNSKNYHLIYTVKKDAVEYCHFERSLLSATKLKVVSEESLFDDKAQPTLKRFK